ncbi:ATP-binding protein [Noviherbaspirillum sp. ST9]|uniref:ATP-binding protein n=1 Tax=Noviherbaspirillum sp. ST9 TaxID=3401606 RepID=UPI003B58AEB7
MDGAIRSIEAIFDAMPLALLEVWGRFGYLLGFFLMVCAFGGFTFRPGNQWGLGRQRQTWDAKALRSLVLTFVLVLGSGYLGSFIVLVPGAQTFESLKDLSVFLCIVLFGYPALIIVPFAYGLSDLIEGVPPAFLLDWFFGYFINPACFWIAYQLIGKNPDFRQVRTWGMYLLFVLGFMGIEPQLWGYICSGKFTPDISYRTITPALFFTTGITWIIAPFAMLVALPLARRAGMFWAEIPGHVRERLLRRKEWLWESGKADTSTVGDTVHHGVPIRMFLVAPFIVLVLVMVASTAYFSLRSSEQSATKLAARIHEDNLSIIRLYLNDHMEMTQGADDPAQLEAISQFLQRLSFAQHGRIFILDRTGRQLASSVNSVQPVGLENGGALVERQAAAMLTQISGSLEQLQSEVQFRFDVVTAKPLSRETWLSHAAPYRSGAADWIMVTAMPSAYYLEGVRTGNSRSAMVFAVALTLSLLVAAYLATVVTAPICRISQASEQLMKGDLAQRVPHSRLGELGMLARSFNGMAEALQKSFSDLLSEVEMRKRRERELEESQLRVRLNEDRLQLATRAAGLGIWDWDVERNELVWDDAMYQQYGIDKTAFNGAYEAWSKCLAADDFERASADVAAALRGERDFDSEFRVCWPDGSIHTIKGIAQTIRSEDGRPVRMVGVNYDITQQKHAAEEIMKLNADLEARVIERTAQLEAANKELEAFSYSVSHDLKAPLRGIDGYSQLLEESVSPHLDEEAREFLRNIRKGAAQMHALIEDLLDYARMERRALGDDEVNLAAWVNTIVQEFRHDVTERNFELRCNVPPLAARADREGLAIVLRNLIDNALKFSHNAKPPIIDIGARDSGGNVILWVRDNGIGFDMKFHERIFDIFTRLHRTEEYVGTGVGLALVRKAMQRMGGRVWAESALGRGATFFLELRHG